MGLTLYRAPPNGWSGGSKATLLRLDSAAGEVRALHVMCPRITRRWHWVHAASRGPTGALLLKEGRTVPRGTTPHSLVLRPFTKE